MEIIQVTNPNFHKQTMRALCVANAHHDIQLSTQERTFGYHRKNFLARYERECKALNDRLSDMATSMEASRAREEQERREKERRKADINETRELNVDRSAADENAIQVMKKLIQAAMETPEQIQDVATDRSQTASPSSVKSRASTAKRSGKMPPLQEISPDKLLSFNIHTHYTLSNPTRCFQIIRGPCKTFFHKRLTRCRQNMVPVTAL